MIMIGFTTLQAAVRESANRFDRFETDWKLTMDYTFNKHYITWILQIVSIILHSR
jgi:hypothetical protein